MNPRLRRLRADEAMLREAFGSHPHISVEPGSDDPPTTYWITYRVPGVLLPEGSSQPRRVGEHTARVALVAQYPRAKPYCTIETPLFHPNFGPRPGDEICIGDFWSSGQTIVDIVVKIGQMIQFQAFNIRSPLNAMAAKWSALHPEILPIGEIDLWVGCGGGVSKPLTQQDHQTQMAERVPPVERVRMSSTIDLTDLS